MPPMQEYSRETSLVVLDSCAAAVRHERENNPTRHTSLRISCSSSKLKIGRGFLDVVGIPGWWHAWGFKTTPPLSAMQDMVAGLPRSLHAIFSAEAAFSSRMDERKIRPGVPRIRSGVEQRLLSCRRRDCVYYRGRRQVRKSALGHAFRDENGDSSFLKQRRALT